LSFRIANMDLPVRVDSSAWTGEVPGHPLCDAIVREGRRAAFDDERLPWLVFASGSLLAFCMSCILWWGIWLVAGGPAVQSTGSTGDELIFTCVLVLVGLLVRRSTLSLRWRLARGGLLAVWAVMAARVIDFGIALAAPGPGSPTAVFVERAHGTSIMRGDASLGPEMVARGADGRRREIVIPRSILNAVVPGRTCLRAHVTAVQRGHVFFAQPRIQALPREAAAADVAALRARCLRP
jgi:hypothetical protein